MHESNSCFKTKPRQYFQVDQEPNLNWNKHKSKRVKMKCVIYKKLIHSISKLTECHSQEKYSQYHLYISLISVKTQLIYYFKILHMRI